MEFQKLVTAQHWRRRWIYSPIVIQKLHDPEHFLEGDAARYQSSWNEREGKG
jgi:hypothetical protein